jgi:hypothetical protein
MKKVIKGKFQLSLHGSMQIIVLNYFGLMFSSCNSWNYFDGFVCIQVEINCLKNHT